MDGRRISLDIDYNNQSIKREVEDYVSAISFSDSLSDQADSLSLSLGDRERNWMNTWMPKKGASLNVTTHSSTDWNSNLSSSRKLGIFEIDEIGTSGPPNKVEIKGSSVPQSTSLSGQKKSRSWEKTTLKQVVTDIAKKHGMKVYFSFDENPDYDRLDQENEPDLSFLSRICKEAGLSLKIANKAINILDDARLESQPVVATIGRNDSRLKDYSGKDTRSNTYRSCKVTYTVKQQVKQPIKKATTATEKKQAKKEKSIIQNKVSSYTFTPTNPIETDKVLIINEEVNSQAAAIRLAKKSLREKNNGAVTFTLRLVGLFSFYSGQTVKLKDFGNFDGKYIITNCSGNGGSGTETTLELRKCLVGY